MSTRSVRSVLPALALTGVMVAASACSGDSGGDKDESADGSAAPSPQVSATPVDESRVSPKNLPKIPAVDDVEGAITDAKMGACSTKQGKRQVRATLKNSTGSATDYLVVVSWTNAESDVLARGVGVVKGLGAGASKKVVIRAAVPAGVSQCTFLVQRGSIGG